MTLDTNVYATASQTLSCKIDKTAPTSLSISLASTSTTLTGNANDSLSGIKYWAIDQSATKDADTSGWTEIEVAEKSTSKTSTADLTGNAKNYYLHVKDEAGNVSNSSACGVHGSPVTSGTKNNAKSLNTYYYYYSNFSSGGCTWKSINAGTVYSQFGYPPTSYNCSASGQGTSNGTITWRSRSSTDTYGYGNSSYWWLGSYSFTCQHGVVYY